MYKVLLGLVMIAAGAVGLCTFAEAACPKTTEDTIRCPATNLLYCGKGVQSGATPDATNCKSRKDRKLSPTAEKFGCKGNGESNTKCINKLDMNNNPVTAVCTIEYDCQWLAIGTGMCDVNINTATHNYAPLFTHRDCVASD